MPQIHTIPILPFGMLNAFLVEEGGSLVLFDAGLPGSTDRIGSVLKKLGCGFEDLRAIILSHAHIDHAGSVAEIKSRSGAAVIVQKAELPYLQGAPMLFRPSGTFGRLFALTGLIARPAPAFVPDLIVDGSYDLRDFGISGHLLHTPGHTPGSQSLVLTSGDILAGDLVASGILLGGIAFRNHPKSPPFEEDPVVVAQSLKTLLNLGAQRFFLGHGGPLGVSAVARHACRLAQD